MAIFSDGKDQDELNDGLDTGIGTIFYMAPEIVEESTDYTEKVDIW